MTPQIWLSLDNNYENMGTLGPVTVNTAPTYVDDSAIGNKAMKTGQLKITAAQAGQLFNKDEFSFCCWLKIIGETGSHKIFGTEDRMYSIFLWSTPKDLHLNWYKDNGVASTFIGYLGNNFFELNTWTHLAVTYSEKLRKAYIYKNGSLYATVNQSQDQVRTDFARDTRLMTNADYRLFNDYRVYNRYLSAGEVREIARGLVRHYTFNDACSGVFNSDSSVTNTATTAYDASGFNKDGAVTGTVQLAYDTIRYNSCINLSGGGYITADSLPTQVKTISFWVKGGGTITTVMFADYNTKIGFGFSSARYPIVAAAVPSNVSGAQFTKDGYDTSKWNHIVITKSDSNVYGLYINGQAMTPNGNNYWTHNTTNLCIGCRNNGSYTTKFNGKISDFRAYVKLFTQDDVTDLYQTSAYAHKSNAMEAYRYEEINNPMELKKTGQLSVYNVAENQKNMFSIKNISATQWDNENNQYISTSPVNSSTYGVEGFTMNNVFVPYGFKYIISVEVYIPTAHRLSLDINNNVGWTPGVTDQPGNDHDMQDKRTKSNLNIPAATWTTVTWSAQNTKVSTEGGSNANPDKLPLQVWDTLRLYTVDDTEPTTWYIRNCKMYICDPNDEITIGKLNYIKANQITEI